MSARNKKTSAAGEKIGVGNEIASRFDSDGGKMSGGELSFSKKQLIAKMSEYKDVLAVLLDEKKTYTLRETELLLKKFLERKVK